MKTVLLIVSLAALSVSSYAAVVQDAGAVQPTQDEIIIHDEVVQEDLVPQDEALDYDDTLNQDETVIQDLEDTSSDVAGYSTRDRLLLRNTYSASAIANTVRVLDVTARGSASLRITRIRATQIGANQGATARIISGGIGRNFVTVRIQSARGRGYNVRLEIWGR